MSIASLKKIMHVYLNGWIVQNIDKPKIFNVTKTFTPGNAPDLAWVVGKG